MSASATRPAPECAPRFTLRQLPVAAKLVIAVFLLFVGAGYGSALVQLHFQQASKGQPMPTVEDVVRQFSKPQDADRLYPPPDEPQVVAPKAPTGPLTDCQLRRLLTNPESMPFNGSGSMTPAFTTKSGGWQKDVKKRDEKGLRAEREGERLALVAWIDAGGKKEEYEKFPMPDALKGRPITEDYVEGDGPAKTVKVKDIVEERCLKCHQGATGQGKADLSEYEALAKYLKPIPTSAAGGNGGRGATRAVRQQVDVEKLTQSTHAHALSFATLFALTGLVFAFSSYPGWLRVLIAPLPLVAQAIDLSCWWLARLDGIGPYFAMAILVTGGVVGLSLAAQIVLGVFDLFGRVGKAVLVLLFLAAGGGLYVFGTCVVEEKVLKPEREALVREAERLQQAQPVPAAEKGAKPGG